MPTKQTIVNIPGSSRGVATEFTELPPKFNIGPAIVLPPNVSLETNALPTPPVQTVATWKAMDRFDEDLKKAILDFIDTTKEGVKAPHTNGGRTKTLTFDFFGTGTKSIRPGEIGEFYLTFSYPPGATSTTSTVSNVQSVTAFNASA